MRALLPLVLLALVGCANNPFNSPYAKSCADDLGISLEPWYKVGGVQAELVAMCVQKREAAKS